MLLHPLCGMYDHMIHNVPEELHLIVCRHGRVDNDGLCIRSDTLRSNWRNTAVEHVDIRMLPMALVWCSPLASTKIHGMPSATPC